MCIYMCNYVHVYHMYEGVYGGSNRVLNTLELE